MMKRWAATLSARKFLPHKRALTLIRPNSTLPSDCRPLHNHYAQENDNGSRIIDVDNLALEMREKVRLYTKQNPGRVRLAGVLAETSDSNASRTYSEKIAETLAEDSIDFELTTCSADKPSEVTRVIRSLNEREDVHGILVFYPIFQGTNEQFGSRGPYLNRSTGVFYKSDDDWIRDVVRADKDVEGLKSSRKFSRMFRTRTNTSEVYIPCTALGVFRILEAYNSEKIRENATITVVNRSEIFGRPLAALLAQHGASVYSIDENSILEFRPGGRLRRRNDTCLEECLAESNTIVTGVPSASFQLPVHTISPGSFVVNVAECSNVDTAQLLEIPGVCLVPNVGKVTIAALESNLISLHSRSYRLT